ncbi:MAG: type II toxin-antitoxin system Phd/YefM family antitoxin [Lachnospiraceae bacterium]|jgi:prevent-host-death family protein|nr:type II toxin-antitoxin system Phd/YefM family antitoxin [Lachnospiraceae bacterium]
MTSVSIFEAKANLSKYVSSVASGEESYIIIMKNGKPVAKLVPLDKDTDSRIGMAKGRLPALNSLEEFNSIDVASDFCAGESLL